MAGPHLGVAPRGFEDLQRAREKAYREQLAYVTIAETEAWTVLKAYLTEKANPARCAVAQNWDEFNRIKGASSLATEILAKIDRAQQTERRDHET